MDNFIVTVKVSPDGTIMLEWSDGYDDRYFTYCINMEDAMDVISRFADRYFQQVEEEVLG